MRLIEAKTLVVKEFFTDIPPYAILSHTWGDGEVSFQHMQDLDVASKLQGFRKIQGCADLAIANGHDWIWVDTCCIDKTSSAELSEAINSMFAWYRDSAVCYVYLADVPGITDAMLCDFYTGGPQKLYVRHLIACSRWFTRGWTLQELVAPCDVEFFTAEWKSLGTKDALEAFLSEKTGIPRAALAGGPLSEYSAAEKMSWASQRVTTREEDAAYCLLGIFDVHMPLLYGESTSAFVRLQEEILKRTEDLSLLVWTKSAIRPRPERRSVLARHPSAFGAPALTEAFLETATDGPKRAARYMFPVRRDKLAPLQLKEQQMLHSPPVMTNRGLLTTIWLSPILPPVVHQDAAEPPGAALHVAPLKKCHTLFACAFSTATLDISDQKMNRHRAPCLIGLTLDTEIDLATETGDDGQLRTLSLNETLLKDSRPFVAWRSRTWDLMCIEMSDAIISRLVPRQVYLSTNDRQHQRPRIPTLARVDVDRARLERIAQWRSTSNERPIRVQCASAPGAPHILYRAVHSAWRSSPSDDDAAAAAGPVAWPILKATLTAVTLPFKRAVLTDELTHLGTISLRVCCQKELDTDEIRLMGAAPARHETRVNVELGLVRVAYHAEIQRLRCALVLAPTWADAKELECRDRSYVALGCGHVMCVAVRGMWGKLDVVNSVEPESERWHVLPSLDISIS